MVRGDQDAPLARPRRPCPKGCGPGGAGLAAPGRAASAARRRASGRVTFALPPQPRNAARDLRGAPARRPRRCRCAASPRRELVVARRRPRRSARREATSLSIAATSAPEWLAMMSTRPRWSMCWWVSTISSMSSIEWPCSASWCCSSSSALPEFGPGVDERERIVLDQVGVDPPDGERGRDAQAVDARLARPLERLPGGQRLAHERMTRRTSSVRASISSCETPPGSASAAARCSTGAR